MEPTSPHLLVVGAGSVGRRHARNFRSLSCRVSAVDPRSDRRNDISSDGAVEATYPDFETAIGSGVFDAVVIASPTKFHVPQALEAIEHRLPVYLEKPPALDLEGANALEVAAAHTSTPVLLGYTWRWWQALRHLRTLVHDGAIGTVRHIRCTMSAHLEDWHPYERYQDFFMSSKALGGGALLDESHWIDLANWIMGPPDEVWATIGRISDLEIDADDNVDILLSYASGAKAVLHLDIHGRPHERSLTVSGSHGTIHWSDDPNVVRVGTGAASWTGTPFDEERNDMFFAAATEFLSIVRGEAEPSCSLQDGIRVMRVVDAARRSSDEGGVIRVAFP